MPSDAEPLPLPDPPPVPFQSASIGREALPGQASAASGQPAAGPLPASMESADVRGPAESAERVVGPACGEGTASGAISGIGGGPEDEAVAASAVVAANEAVAANEPFPPGSILKRPLPAFWGWFFLHMGIYVGNGQVIHFNGERKKTTDATIRREPLEVFAGGFPVKLHAAPRNAAHAAAVCAQADHFLRDSGNRWNGRYGMFLNNCEDFTITCFQVRYRQEAAVPAENGPTR